MPRRAAGPECRPRGPSGTSNARLRPHVRTSAATPSHASPSWALRFVCCCTRRDALVRAILRFRPPSPPADRDPCALEGNVIAECPPPPAAGMDKHAPPPPPLPEWTNIPGRSRHSWPGPLTWGGGDVWWVCNLVLEPSVARAVLKGPDFFLLRTVLKDCPKGPPTANRQPPPTANRQPLPTATNHPSRTANCRHLPPTAANTTNRQPPTGNLHQPPTANRYQPWLNI